MLAFAQGMFRCLSLGDVDDGCHHHQPVLCLNRIEPDLDRELLTALLEPVEISSGSPPPGAASSKKRCPHLGMCGAEALRHQHLDRASQQLGSRVSKNALGLGIDHHNGTAGSDHDHRIRRKLDDETVASFSAALWLCLRRKWRLAISHSRLMT